MHTDVPKNSCYLPRANVVARGSVVMGNETHHKNPDEHVYERPNVQQLYPVSHL